MNLQSNESASKGMSLGASAGKEIAHPYPPQDRIASHPTVLDDEVKLAEFSSALHRIIH